jgi:hypothetical protein
MLAQQAEQAHSHGVREPAKVVRVEEDVACRVETGGSLFGRHDWLQRYLCRDSFASGSSAAPPPADPG